MKKLIISICAILLSGCDGPVKPTSIEENELAKQTELSNNKALSCCNSIHEAAANGNVEGIKAHIDAANTLLKSRNPVGRKFDFLMQEFNRETNTLCAKSNSKELTAIGIEMKVTIDQMREQVQNVE